MASLRALSEVAGARGQTLAQLVLAWALRDERMTSLLIDCHTGSDGAVDLWAEARTGTV